VGYRHFAESRRASGEAPGTWRGRFSSKRKAETVLRLLRGEEIGLICAV
jgi:hypothetical protein